MPQDISNKMMSTWGYKANLF